MKKFFYSFLVILTGCSTFSSSPFASSEMGKASLKGTATGSLIKGSAKFEEKPEGLKVSVKFQNVPPGRHGLHIHQFGDCGDLGLAAGDHFNPDGSPHGSVLADGVAKVHPGDLGNIEIGTDGTGQLKEVIPGLSLSTGKYNVAGRSIILHEKEDDGSQPLGNAGGRIGCGKIVIREGKM